MSGCRWRDGQQCPPDGDLPAPAAPTASPSVSSKKSPKAPQSPGTSPSPQTFQPRPWELHTPAFGHALAWNDDEAAQRVTQHEALFHPSCGEEPGGNGYLRGGDRGRDRGVTLIVQELCDLGQGLNLSEPQFPPLYNRGNIRTTSSSSHDMREYPGRA